MKRYLVFALLLLPHPAATQLTPRDIAARARPAVVRVTALAGEHAIGTGTGFLIAADGRLVTNHHVIEDADALRIETASGERYDRVYLVSDDAARDIAILRIPAVDAPTLTMGDDRALQVGDPLYVMGNPMGLDGTFSDGLVSAKRTVDGIAWIQMSAPISPGSSGGPVFNDLGEVVGIATLTLTDGQNLNMAIPARYAAGLLAMNEEPRLFEDVADELTSIEQPMSGAGAPARSAADTDTPAWARVLAEEVEAIDDLAAQTGYEATHELVAEMLDEGETYWVEYMFDERGEFVVAGVCDIDCTDLDVGVYDGNGELVAKDVDVDDRPIVDFVVTRPGKFNVAVNMVTCSTEPCGFALRAYRKR